MLKLVFPGSCQGTPFLPLSISIGTRHLNFNIMQYLHLLFVFISKYGGHCLISFLAEVVNRCKLAVVGIDTSYGLYLFH